MNIWLILFLFFSFQALSLAVIFLFKKRGNPRTNRLLSLYLFLFSYNIFYNFLYWSEELYTPDFINLVHTNHIPWLLYGPIFFLYISHLTRPRKWAWYDALHLLPLALFLINYSPFLLSGTEEKIAILAEQRWADMMYYFIPYRPAILVGSMLFYFGLALYQVKRHIISNNKSRWFALLIYCYLGYVLSFGSYFLLSALGWIRPEYDYFIGFSMILFIAGVTYFSYLQPRVFDGLKISEALPFSKYQKTGLSQSLSEELLTKLKDLMEREQLYLDAYLRLDTLAEKLDTSRHFTSQIINEHFDLNFFDFINGYRVEFAKKLLLEEKDLSIKEVLYSSGFNNRDSFYKAFKKFVGLTPGEYKSRSALRAM